MLPKDWNLGKVYPGLGVVWVCSQADDSSNTIPVFPAQLINDVSSASPETIYSPKYQ